jgi:zinc transport system substrate-binding protein
MEKNKGTWNYYMKKFVLILLILLVAACTKEPSNQERIIFTSVMPHKYIVTRIAGDLFEVHTLADSRQNHHSYSPTAGQIVKLSSAALYFRTGVEFEESIISKLEKNMKRLGIIDMRNNIRLRDSEETCDHEDHDHHHNTSVIKDVHIWLSPRLMKIQASTVFNELSRIDSLNIHFYRKNLDLLLNELDSLDLHLKRLLEPYKGSELFVFHPAFGYLADDYGLIQRAVEIDGKEPGAKALANVIEKAKISRPKVIFVQPQFSDKSAQTIAGQIGCAVVSINPLPEDYIAEMKSVAEKIEAGLRK